MKLDRAGIEKRLTEVREAARDQKLGVVVSLLADSEEMSVAKLAGNIVSALTWLQAKREYRHVTMQLEMVALNLKNLR